MTCTPIGSATPSVQTGTAQTGRPMNEIGCVNRPRFGRTSISRPSSTKVFWPISGARQGVAGASRMSTSRNSLDDALAKPAAQFLRLDDPGARQHRAGDQPIAHVRIEIARPLAQPVDVQRRALDHRDEIGRRARAPRLPGSSIVARRAQRAGDAIHRLERGRLAAAREIAAEPRDAQAGEPSVEAGRGRLDRARGLRGIARIRPLHRVVARREIADRTRERPEMIEARDERKRARAREPAVGRLQAE